MKPLNEYISNSILNESFTEKDAVKKAFPKMSDKAVDIVASWYKDEGAIEDFNNVTAFVSFIKGDIYDMMDAATDKNEYDIVMAEITK